MQTARPLGQVVFCLFTAAAICCNGNESGITEPVDEVLPTPSVVTLQSDAGDYVGQGKTYLYTQANSIITVGADGPLLTVIVDGDEGWSGRFQGPSGLTQVELGQYSEIQRFPFHNPAKGGLSWSGEGRGCNSLQGWFAVDTVTYLSGVLAAIDLRFEQRCEGSTSALQGTIHWRYNDPTTPPGPVNPPPAGLWRPSPGSTPDSGDFIYLESDLGDFIGLGQTYSYTGGDANIAVELSGGHVSVEVRGDQRWKGDFQAMTTLDQLEPGYYASLQRYPFHNPAKGGLSWYGEGRGCNTLNGWFVVDNVTYSDGSFTTLDLRFEQRCGGGTSALHGAIHWGG